ncbi:MAG: SycD/LcrH family type III secretion system chaperone [Lentisphaeria bacterium]|nr:SycD/LcrH family type III secretion system chaperone [Lentisphaeria bacterium]
MLENFDVKNLTPEMIEEATKHFMDMGTVRELKGLSDEEMESIYSVAFGYYNTGRYDDAEKIFRFLVLFDHVNQRYWMGLGAVSQVKKEYMSAITCYGYASILNLKNPKPQYHAAECFAAMGDKTNALSALAALEEYCPQNTEEGREYRAMAAELKKKLEG